MGAQKTQTLQDFLCSGGADTNLQQESQSSVGDNEGQDLTIPGSGDVLPVEGHLGGSRLFLLPWAHLGPLHTPSPQRLLSPPPSSKATLLPLITAPLAEAKPTRPSRACGSQQLSAAPCDAPGWCPRPGTVSHSRDSALPGLMSPPRSA